MRFNRKALEVFVLLCLVVATTTVNGSGLWAHVGEATAASVLILLSLLRFRHYGRRTN
jgi:hypothetical protein